ADRPRIDRVIANDRIEQRGLAGAVRSDQAGDAAACNGERDVAIGFHAAVRLADVGKLDDGAVVHSAPPGCGSRPAPTGVSCLRSPGGLAPKRCGYFSISQPTMPCWK